jgi:hypothetical protein
MGLLEGASDQWFPFPPGACLPVSFHTRRRISQANHSPTLQIPGKCGIQAMAGLQRVNNARVRRAPFGSVLASDH